MNNNQTKSLFSRTNNIGFIIGIITSVIFMVNSLVCFIYRNTIYLSKEFIESFSVNDLANLFIIVFFIVITFVFYNKNTIIFIFPGFLLFIIYNSIAYLISIMTIISMIVNSILIVLSLISFIIIIKSYNKNIKLIPLSSVATRIFGIVLLLFAIMFIGRAINIILSIFNGKTTLTQVEISINISDLIISIFWIISSVFLMIKSKFGIFYSFACYFQGTLLFIGLIVFLILKPIINQTDIVAIDIIVIAVMSLILIIPFIFYCLIIAKVLNKEPAST